MQPHRNHEQQIEANREVDEIPQRAAGNHRKPKQNGAGIGPEIAQQGKQGALSAPHLGPDLREARGLALVAIGGYGLQIAGDLTGTAYTDAGNFTWAFLLVGLVSAASAWVMYRLPADAGQEMSGRAMPGQEVAEPKAAQRPGT